MAHSPFYRPNAGRTNRRCLLDCDLLLLVLDKDTESGASCQHGPFEVTLVVSTAEPRRRTGSKGKDLGEHGNTWVGRIRQYSDRNRERNRRERERGRGMDRVREEEREMVSGRHGWFLLSLCVYAGLHLPDDPGGSPSSGSLGRLCFSPSSIAGGAARCTPESFGALCVQQRRPLLAARRDDRTRPGSTRRFDRSSRRIVIAGRPGRRSSAR